MQTQQANDSGKEQTRLQEEREGRAAWKKWGPYLSERQWGTVREDYSANGDAWNYFTHDQAQFRAYRWGEDGLAGICDNRQLLCFAVALWNGKDPILKERLFGLSNSQGNHGEDVKEYYFYLDNTPTHSYMKYLYKYPQAAYPYQTLIDANRARDKRSSEYELLDTGIFDKDRYFDVFIEYAKAGPEDILIRITICNRGPEPGEVHALPTLWFRNTWSWDGNEGKPGLRILDSSKDARGVAARHSLLGARFLYCQGAFDLLDVGAGGSRILSLVNPDKLRRMLGYMLNENEFLSKYGIRSLSRYHADHPYVFNAAGQEYRVHYVPGDSDSGMFGGNSNWRGPIWMPMQLILIRGLANQFAYLGSDFKVECPVGFQRAEAEHLQEKVEEIVMEKVAEAVQKKAQEVQQQNEQRVEQKKEII